MDYESEEEVRRAIQNEDLVLVGGWLKDAPENSEDEDSNPKFNQTRIFDQDGDPTEVPLGRHNGKRVLLPTKISSVLAICRNFDDNLYRAYFFPDSQYPAFLYDKLFDVNRLSADLPLAEHLFFGKITRYSRLSHRNVIYMESVNFPEVKIYTWPEHDKRKHIGNDSIGRMILVHCKFETEGGDSLRCKIHAWGQYSLLPERYEKYLPVYD